ncbi:hypothetical protein E2C01_046755 [Portunus trituberculatus]|uniref:Uncharacterized protein n=1 Tax=Portunus trituberculatus TaxID=210409 RepID=A0A5B7G5Z3_PORTR|nr:hypothetical protein [Portunus trituberculatus]
MGRKTQPRLEYRANIKRFRKANLEEKVKRAEESSEVQHAQMTEQRPGKDEKEMKVKRKASVPDRKLLWQITPELLCVAKQRYSS